MSSSSEILHLYRQIIKHAKVFPSKNRSRILREIRVEFRENKSLVDPDKRKVALEKATKGLSQLMTYTTLRSDSSQWVVNLDKEPMPRPSK